MTFQQRDIHERIYKLVLRVIKVIKEIPKTQENKIIIDQLVRSTTSIGANDCEADGCETKKDFLAKYAIVRKEAKETEFWLRLIADTNPNLGKRMNLLLQEINEIVKIVSKIIGNTRKNL